MFRKYPVLLFVALVCATLTSIDPAHTQSREAWKVHAFPVSPGRFFGDALVQAGTEIPTSARTEISPLLQDNPGIPSAGRKSVGLAVLYSLLLPGMGELYAGDYGSGKYLTAVEGALWLTLGAVDVHARSLEDDARSFASQHAGFEIDGKNDGYFIDVGNFNSVYDYNEQVLRDRDAYKLYDPLSSDYWMWDSELNRSLYRDQRVSSDQMFNNTRFVVAAIAVNHVLSAVNAARLVISGNRSNEGGSGVEIGARILGSVARPHGIALSVTRQF